MIAKDTICSWFEKGGKAGDALTVDFTEAMMKRAEEAKRAFEAMMPMKKIDVAAIDKARRGS